MSAKTKEPKVKEDSEQVKDNSKKQVDEFMKKFKTDHLNFEETVKWKASTGSLIFDAELGGGFSAGGIKVNGASFAGKTNCVVTCVSNALATVANAKGVWFKAEGRLDDEVIERATCKFVYNVEDWEVGTVLVLDTNIYEFVIDLINSLVKNNPQKYRYIFVIDSVDALIRRDDESKPAEEGEKVAAGGLLLSLLFKKAGNVLNKLGHCLFAISQIRSKVEGKYTAKDQNKKVGGGGSNALTHGVNQVWNFKGRKTDNNIVEDGKTVGHYCEIELSKGVKERIDVMVKYPVRHGQKRGKSVWVEYEIADLLLQWELIEKKGSWLSLEPEFLAELKQNGFEIDDDWKIQGTAKLKAWLEENPAINQYLYKKFIQMFCEN